MIKFFGLDRQYANIKHEILEATDKVLSSGQVLDGENTKKFEDTIALYTDRKHAVSVNSCSTALLFTFMSYAGLTEGYRNALVGMPAVSFVATANAPTMASFVPKFYDVDEEGLLDISLLDFPNDKLGLLLYVNLYGNVIDYDRLRVVSNFFHDGLPIIEDAAQSFGASVNGIKSGKLGDVSCLSFDPTKNLPNYGSGGMILTDDDNLYKSVLNLRDNGKASGHGVLGTNSKMSEQDCAQMLVKLNYFEIWQARRKGIANYYTEQLKNYVGTPIVADNVVHAWHKYVIKTPDQFRLREHLDAQGIQTKIHYETPLPHHPIFSGYGDDENFPRALAMSQQAVSLPIYPEMTDLEVDQVVTSIKSFYR